MNNICPNCATENEVEYKYCKNCGTPLEGESEGAQASTASGYSADYNYGYNNYGYNNYGQAAGFNAAVPETLGGIPTNDMRLFLGKKAGAIIPKFAKMEITRNNSAWCWPAAIWGFLLGPVGAAFWFFYRKMYKIGGILTAIGVAILIATSMLTAFCGTEVALDSLLTPELQSSLELDSVELTYISSPIANAVEWLSSLATAIVCGLFGYGWYFKSAVKRIARYRASGADMRYYQFALGALGGTSGGALAAVIIGYAFLSEAIVLLPNFLTELVNRL